MNNITINDINQYEEIKKFTTNSSESGGGGGGKGGAGSDDLPTSCFVDVLDPLLTSLDEEV